MRRLIALLIAAFAAAYLAWAPLAPDLAAQVARAHLVQNSGLTVWWFGWYGGVSTPSYSVIVPTAMALLGVRLVGALAILAACTAADRLMQDAPRRRAGVAAFALAVAANAVDGRVTFAAGLAAACWALVAVRRQRKLVSIAFGVLTLLCSPLAALFLGLVLVGVLITEATRRRLAAANAATLLAGAVALQALFPGTGAMPYSWTDPLPAAAACLLVALLCRSPVVRMCSGLMVLAMAACFAVPGAVGDNITRLAWVAAVPVIVGWASVERRLVVSVAAVAVAIWPAADLAEQLAASRSPAARAAFYRPLTRELTELQATTGSSGVGQRVEVVDPANHWSSAYLAAFSLARGWDRQADAADNPIFYDHTLTTSTYQSWLHELAVRWVARPATTLDYASRDEAALIDSKPPYLRPVWHNSDWQLYEVLGATALADGASVTAVNASSITLVPDRPNSTVQLRVRWNRYLAVTDALTQQPVKACIRDVDGWVNLSGLGYRPVVVHSDFSAAATFADTDTYCAGTPGPPGGG